jgi:hypothetical protein
MATAFILSWTVYALIAAAIVVAYAHRSHRR